MVARGWCASPGAPAQLSHQALKGTKNVQGKDYDRELKQAGVKLDRQKPDTKPTNLAPEKLDETTKRKPSRK